MTLKERLESSFEEMLSYRAAVGYATDTYRSSIPPFIRYCAEKHPGEQGITRDMVTGWLSSYDYSNNGKAAFISLLREYTKYLNFLGYDDFIPDEDFSVKRIPFVPYLFSDGELSLLFKNIDAYKGTTRGKRFLPEMVLPVYSRFMYCCGMRPQEPPALLSDDVDLETGDVYIRQSKRHKDRHILMSSDMLDLCRRYDSVAGKRKWFFQKWDGTPYETSWYNSLWRKITASSGIAWRGTPRPYDLRHAFASRNIIRWIGCGKDVMELLPYLSAYMGHSELSSTLYYVHMLPDNLRKSMNIDWEMLAGIYGKGVTMDED
ncbi:MAG: tyrosine-type recombinase/integrase [Lachnospiraceae bacterium]|nr:tyrosine-type recombinase/integrase [Lachnospiraceae bacterium]